MSSCSSFLFPITTNFGFPSASGDVSTVKGFTTFAIDEVKRSELLRNCGLRTIHWSGIALSGLWYIV